jgi:hypothetical protein
VTGLHDERIAQIRHRLETGRPIPGDARYLLDALDHATRGDPENYRFDLAHDAVGENDEEPERVEHHAADCDLLLGRGMRACSCGLIAAQALGVDPYERSADA